jgi:hypothetical protein
MTDVDKAEIITKAKGVNPKIEIFQGKRDAKNKLSFEKA